MKTDQSKTPAADFRLVELSKIFADPNQPRRFYDEEAMADLVASIREKGVIQPILIRPAKDKPGFYMIVCGERRYRAMSKVSETRPAKGNSDNPGLDTIPAVIRDISDEEALDLQLIENLQRKDVHPMEEAVGFDSLVQRGRTNVEIAKRVGKSEFYIRQRLKLMSLSKEWQKAFYHNRIDISTGLKIAVFSADVQKELRKRFGDDGAGNIIFNDYVLRQFSGSLSSAPFDITDPNIDKKAGACTGCKFNSAVALLFAEEAKLPKCNNLSCYNQKCQLDFTAKLSAAKNEADILFINNEYNPSYPDIVKQLEKEGANILNGRYNKTCPFEVIEAPDPVDLDEFDIDDYDNEKQRTAAIESEEKGYQKRLTEYNKMIAGGKFKKAFVVHGYSAGKYVYLKLGKPGSSSEPAGAKSAAAMKEKQAAGTLTGADVKAEITRINERLQRSRELDAAKIHAATLKALEKRPELSLSKPKELALQQVDRGIMVFLLAEHVFNSYGTNRLSFLPKPTKSKIEFDEKYFDTLSKISDKQLAALIRGVAAFKFGNRNLQFGIAPQDSAMRCIAKYLGIDIKSIEAEVAAAREKRETSAANKISSLRKTLAEITGGKTKTPAPAAQKGRSKESREESCKEKIISNRCPGAIPGQH